MSRDKNDDNEDRSYVKNAADPEQVRDAKRKERDKRKAEIDDLKAVLLLPEGRRFLWRMLTHCRTFESIWDNSARIHYNSGRQDVGHFLMAEIVAAEPDALIGMMRDDK